MGNKNSASSNDSTKGECETTALEIFSIVSVIISYFCLIFFLSGALYKVYHYHKGLEILGGGITCKVDNSTTTVCPDGGKCIKNTCKNGTCVQVELFGNIGQNSSKCPICTRK